MNNDRIYYSHDSEVRAMRDMTKVTLFCLAFGVGIGAGLALLFAPSSGRKTRDDLARTVEESMRNGHEALEPVMQQFEKDLGELRKRVEDSVPNLK